MLISMLWHRRAIFEVKWDKLSSSAECRIRTQGLRHLIASRVNVSWLTDWAIEDWAKKLELDSPSLWVVNWPLHWPTSHGESCKALWNELYITSFSSQLLIKHPDTIFTTIGNDHIKNIFTRATKNGCLQTNIVYINSRPGVVCCLS